MGKTSAKVKNRWNEKTYDRICATIPKGYGDKLKEFCEKHGKSVNAVLTEQLYKELKKGE